MGGLPARADEAVDEGLPFAWHGRYNVPWWGVVFPMVYVIILAVLFNVTLDDDYLKADSEMYHGLGKVSIDGLYKYNSNWLICALQPV